MRKLFFPLLAAVILFMAVFGWLEVARGQIQTPPGGQVVLNSETQGENTREIQGPDSAAPNQPLISFIDSPTAGCVQPDPTKNACFINWYYMSVNAGTSNYMISMTVTLNDFGAVANYSGFFQNSMYVPYNMNPQGYQVECGALGAGGAPTLGKSYGYTIRARDTAALGSANYGTVFCPAFIP